MSGPYVWIDSEPGLYTVGFYDPSGKWHPESDHGTRAEAASRVHYLNGGNLPLPEKPRTAQPEWLAEALNSGDGTYKP